MLTEDFVFKWQELIGAALGPFLGVVLSAMGFWIKSYIEKRSARKEAHRQIEIAVSRSLNDAYVLRKQLLWQAKRMKELAAEARAEMPNVVFLKRINTAPFREIYNDQVTSQLKVRSYYVHNKLLFITAGIKETNEQVKLFKTDLEEVFRLNELSASLSAANPNPPIQHETFAMNLEDVASQLQKFATDFERNLKNMVELKVYNNRLRQWKGYWFWLMNERVSKDHKTLNSLERIDAVIADEVAKIMLQADERGANMLSNSSSKADNTQANTPSVTGV